MFSGIEYVAQDSVTIKLPDVGDIYMEYDTSFVKIAKASNFTISFQWAALREMDITFFIYYDKDYSINYKQDGYQIVRLESNDDVNGYRMYDDSIVTEPIESICIPNRRSYVSLIYNRTYDLWVRHHTDANSENLYNFTKFINELNLKL
jgi:hypothetical protein